MLPSLLLYDIRRGFCFPDFSPAKGMRSAYLLQLLNDEAWIVIRQEASLRAARKFRSMPL